MYVGGSLASLFGKVPKQATVRCAKAMALRGGDRMVSVTVMNTPIDTGNLRTSWYQLPLSKQDYLIGMGHRSGVASNVEYAPYVEHGTGLWGPEHRKYEIVPKNAPYLAWRDPQTGMWVRAKKVMHPGSPGQHMIAIAAGVVEFEAEGGVLFADILDEWTRAVEGAAD